MDTKYKSPAGCGQFLIMAYSNNAMFLFFIFLFFTVQSEGHTASSQSHTLRVNSAV